MTNNSPLLRLRVFAGPNGSGKSTVIEKIRSLKIDGDPIDFGVYVNADDIAIKLANGQFRFDDYSLKPHLESFVNTAVNSGLLDADFPEPLFLDCFGWTRKGIVLTKETAKEKLAQIVADFLRKALLKEKKRFSFETVFSHPGKLDIMQQAVAAGYKVYLYFVSTESADINVFRVAARKKKGGHDVPEHKIRSRYERSLDLLFSASQLSYQAFYFDNSIDGADAVLFAHFKKQGDQKVWDEIKEENVPNWFLNYYSAKVQHLVLDKHPNPDVRD